MIRTESLSVRYGKKTALRNVTLEAPAGQITAILGPSGCGKSSYLAAINRMTELIPTASTSGRLLVEGRDVGDDKNASAQLRRNVGMIFQKPNPFPLSIQRNITLALREHGVRDRETLERITQQTLDDVGLWDEVKDRLNTPALHLSGGQQQRLCIARAVALEPQVLLMDEPCSALDPIASAKVESLIASLRGRYTVLIVTHNLAQARRIADSVAVFWVRDGAGELIESGSTEQIFTNAQDSTVAAYLAGAVG